MTKYYGITNEGSISSTGDITAGGKVIIGADATTNNDAVRKSQLDTASAAARNRGNHTGTQDSTTISDFTSAVTAIVNPAINTALTPLLDGADTSLDSFREVLERFQNNEGEAADILTRLTQAENDITTLSQGAVTKFTGLVGNGTLSSFTVATGIDNPIVQILEVSTGEVVHPTVTISGQNITVNFGTYVPANNAFKVVAI